MKKAFDQTVRDLKREVNKKVLKVPGIEQKVLDATSNEPWGPHGSHLADIAQATRNYHEYQMIMAVLWKRINDTGRNWRHVYKALTVLEYLVAHGSERVIDEIKEHAYQISTLSDFQYIDSSGRDQGSNVRKKSQSLVALVNDKERIQEARQKALVNRDKFRSPTSAGGMDRPGYGDRYDDDRYRRDAGRNGYGDQYDDDRSSRGGDSYSRDGDRYGRDSDDRYARDGYRDDDYRGRSQSNDDYQSGARSRSSDRYRERAFDDDRYSSRSSDARAEDHSQNQRRLERKFSEQNIGAPPSYEEAVTDVRSPVHDERDAEIPVATAPKAATLTGNISHSPQTTSGGITPVPADEGSNGFDEFDPRGAVPAAPPPSTGEMELLGSLADSNALAIVPTTTSTTTSESGFAAESVSGSTFVALSSASTVLNQTTEDPFGDGPFKAIPSAHSSNQQNFSSTNNIQPATVSQTTEPVQPAPVQMQTTSGFDFGDTFEGLTYAPSTSTQFVPSESPAPNQNFDVLADILPPSGPSAQAGPFLALPAPTESPHSHTSVPGHFPSQSGYGAPVTSQGAFYAQNPPPQPSIPGNFAVQSGYGASVNSQGGYNAQNPNSQAYTGNFSGQPGYGASVSSQVAFSAPSGQPLHQSGPGNFQAQSGYGVPQVASQAAFSAPSALAPQQNLGTSYSQTRTATPLTSHTSLPGQTTQLSKPQPTKDKFETKSTVWADTLSRGLVNLNISGAKTNPLADIGVDFEAINRREKREKPVPQQAPISTINMGKAMGSGSGIGRAGAGALAPPNSMMGGGMGMGGGGGMGMRGGGMGMGGYGSGMNQQPGGIGMGMGMGMNNMGMGMGMNNMGMGMGMNNMGMGMGMGGGGGMGMGMNNMGMQMGMNNMGMNQGAQMRPPQGPNMPGYNPMMGSGGYQPQNPYGGYR